MAQAPSNPKIEELRFRLKTDPKNRIFYPLAEELRKVSQFVEAEQVLRTGLTHHPTYLSAWVSLGRVLRDQGKDADAAEALVKAMQLDPGNVVAARLLADAYLDLGQKVEAIKKYKLVQALMPSDESVEVIIARLEADLNPPPPAVEPAPAPEPEPEPHAAVEAESHVEPAVGAVTEPEPAEPEPLPFAEPEPVAPLYATPFVEASIAPEPEAEPEQPQAHEAEPVPEPLPVPFVDETDALDESPFAGDDAQILAAAEHTFAAEEETPAAAATHEPVSVAHVDSPFQESATDSHEDAVAVDEPAEVPVEHMPLPVEVPAPVVVEKEAAVVAEEPVAVEEEPPADVFPGTIETPFDLSEHPVPVAPPTEDLTETMTMADLYARQGLTGSAREIYDHILQRQPENAIVRAKRDALDADVPVETPIEAPVESADEIGAVRNPKVVRLETWLAKVGRREAGGV